MSGIFKILFDLKLKSHNQPLEDYLTELFSFCLQQDINIMNDFLSHYKIEKNIVDSFDLSTQYELIKLNNHHSNSRPDIVVFLEKRTIFFENKIESLEGHNQLQRYAEHLDRIKFKKRTLVYITKNYDNKDSNEIFKNCKNNIDFIQIRWHSIYKFLKKYKSNPLILECLTFMKQIKLSMNNQFSPIDIMTLTNFSNVRKMLDETMYGKVSERFEEINKGISKKSATLTQLRNHDRYIYWKDHNDGLWVGLGYWMNSNNEKDYPEIGIVIELNPKSSKREEITNTFKDIGESYTDWFSYNTSNPSSWSGVFCGKSIQNYLSNENQISEITNFFMETLEQVEMILSTNPILPRRK